VASTWQNRIRRLREYRRILFVLSIYYTDRLPSTNEAVQTSGSEMPAMGFVSRAKLSMADSMISGGTRNFQ
jgi:hypothetical protein